MTNTEECLQKGLLKKGTPDFEKAESSLAIAEKRLEEVHKLINLDSDLLLVQIYMAMFHTARALLFKDGIKERSHYCMFLYVKEKYGDKLEARFLNELNALREQRHEILYGLEICKNSLKERQQLLSTAKDFLKQVRTLLSK
ncbi:MAG: HEPN domain-containing protein [Candidatus Woesearchaeota archaeon]|nr:HEPN domain-containing protein [Candidatus Woesearchaeota archaeon]